MVIQLETTPKVYRVNEAIEDTIDLSYYIDYADSHNEYRCCSLARAWLRTETVWKCLEYCPFPFCYQEELDKRSKDKLLQKIGIRCDDLTELPVKKTDYSKYHYQKKKERTKSRISAQIDRLREENLCPKLVKIMSKWGAERVDNLLRYHKKELIQFSVEEATKIANRKVISPEKQRECNRLFIGSGYHQSEQQKIVSQCGWDYELIKQWINGKQSINSKAIKDSMIRNKQSQERYRQKILRVKEWLLILESQTPTNQ